MNLRITETVNDNPGPGTYKLKSTVTDLPCTRLPDKNKPERSKSSTDLHAPGPGAYDDPKKEAKGWKFGTGNRTGLNVGESARNPGPGTYEINSKNTHGISIKLKHEQPRRDFVPGPGN
mmetsp:Transcript_53707/g.117212  ORF Transcript_53707/g.117212 Transcript_53707/m.117212 type:complete len:119 (-) Transcript_53707:704-1060(-)